MNSLSIILNKEKETNFHSIIFSSVGTWADRRNPDDTKRIDSKRRFVRNPYTDRRNWPYFRLIDIHLP